MATRLLNSLVGLALIFSMTSCKDKKEHTPAETPDDFKANRCEDNPACKTIPECIEGVDDEGGKMMHCFTPPQTCSDDGRAVVKCAHVDDSGCLQPVLQQCGDRGCHLAECRPVSKEKKGIYHPEGVINVWGVLEPGKAPSEGFIYEPETLTVDATGQLVLMFKTREPGFHPQIKAILEMDRVRMERQSGPPADFRDYGDDYLTVLIPFQLDSEALPSHAQTTLKTDSLEQTLSLSMAALPIKRVQATHVHFPFEKHLAPVRTISIDAPDRQLQIKMDENDCLDGWISMDVEIIVAEESFKFDPSCAFSFDQELTTKSGVHCTIRAGMCSNFSPKKMLEVQCDNDTFNRREIACPSK